MKHLHETIDMTTEAAAAADVFFRTLRSDAGRRGIAAPMLEELCDSLEEHLGFALRRELDARRLLRCDAQLMMEQLLALGPADELLDELARERPAQGPSNSGVPPALPPAPDQAGPGPDGQSWRTRFWRKPLCRSSRDRWLLGVCGGFAEFFGVPSLLLRLLFIFSGVGILVYLLLGLLLPREEELVPGQPVKASGCLVGAMEACFRLAMLAFIYVPLSLVAGGVALAGISKILFELGIAGLPSHDTWSFFVTGLPGLLSGLSSLVIGLAVLGVTLHFAVATFSTRALLGMNTRKLLVFAAVIALLVQGGLWSLSRHLNGSQARDRRILSFSTGTVREIVIDSGIQNLPLRSLELEVVGRPDTATITVELIRKATGRSVGHAGETLNEILAHAAVNDGKLTLSIGLPKPRWWFYPSPALEAIIRVPASFPVSLRSQGGHGAGTLRLRDLSGPVLVDADAFGIELDRLLSPQLEVVTQLGSVEGRHLDIASCTLYTNLGSIELDQVAFGNGRLETALGSIELNRATGPITLGTRLGSIDITNYTGTSLDARTESGSIDARLPSLASGSRLSLETQMGAIDIRLPSSAKPHLELDTKLGHIDNEFGTLSTAADAPRIRAVTSMGSIGISRLDDAEEEEEPEEPLAEAPEN